MKKNGILFFGNVLIFLLILILLEILIVDHNNLNLYLIEQLTKNNDLICKNL